MMQAQECTISSLTKKERWNATTLNRQKLNFHVLAMASYYVQRCKIHLKRRISHSHNTSLETSIATAIANEQLANANQISYIPFVKLRQPYFLLYS